MPLTPKVTSGASTITFYTKYIPPAQHAGWLHSKSGTTKMKIQLCSGAYSRNTRYHFPWWCHMSFNVILRTTTDEFNVLPRTFSKLLFEKKLSFDSNLNFQFLKEGGRSAGQWIAARFDGMPPSQFELGRQSKGAKENLPIQNRPLEVGRKYKVFLRAYTPDNVGF